MERWRNDKLEKEGERGMNKARNNVEGSRGKTRWLSGVQIGVQLRYAKKWSSLSYVTLHCTKEWPRQIREGTGSSPHFRRFFIIGQARGRADTDAKCRNGRYLVAGVSREMVEQRTVR